MRIAMMSPIAWRTPPRHYGPWEQVVSLLTEGLVARGVDVTLFATADSETGARFHAIAPRPYEEDSSLIPKVWESLHISEVFERAQDFDLIHNHFDFLPLTYSGLVKTPVITTIHGFSSEKILPVYRKYNSKNYYVSISDADRSPDLTYAATIHHGIDVEAFTFNPLGGQYLLFFGRIHPDKGAREAIEIARLANRDLLIAGIIQDEHYFETEIKPHLDGSRVQYLGSVGPEHRNSILGGAACLLHPINFNEPFGLSVVEANACGTPAIAFSRGSMPEIITDGLNGFLVSSSSEAVDAVNRIHTISRGDCREVAERRFSKDRMIDEYLKVYGQIVKETTTEDRRPWGYYEILSNFPDHKVKRIVVHPGMKLSLQSHHRRRESWTIVKGHPIVTRDDEQTPLDPGQSIQISKEAKHRIFNPGSSDVVFVEVQTGDYFGEDDIERFEDDFGRV
jgi:glycosyltransferase involved in cell wall biosynthesis/quercetin dioxygenase-like cupin family protein